MFEAIKKFFLAIFSKRDTRQDILAELNMFKDFADKELELRIKRLELANLTILKRLVQLKFDEKLDKSLLDSYTTDDTKQPTIH